jgi:acetolactate synthase I/II/III large subunit
LPRFSRLTILGWKNRIEEGTRMNGAEILVTTAAAAGIEICFANPGTTEIPLVMAFDAIPGIRPILGLSEGVCAGAADGYGRMLDRPAMTLLHLGPGFANSIAYLHDARRARTPVLSIIGEHASWHRPADAPLTMDIEALTATVSGWQRTVRSANTLSRDTAEAIGASRYGQVASLIVPHDYQEAEGGPGTTGRQEPVFDSIDSAVISRAAQLLREGGTALLLGGRALRTKGLQAAALVKASTGCDLLAETFPAFMERGAGLPPVERIPYFPEPARELLSRYRAVIQAGAKEPVTFFGYKGIGSHLLTDEQKTGPLATERQDVVEVLEALAHAVRQPGSSRGNLPSHGEVQRPGVPDGELTAEKACITLAALQPEHAIIIDEGLTSSFTYYPLTAHVPPHSLTTVTGGAIGYGMPCAIGAAIAFPRRPVINLQADGSAMYTLQALWTQARESLDITTLICSNQSYNILRIELERAGIASPGHRARSLTELRRPVIDWVRIAQGFGVPAVSVNTAPGLARELSRAMGEPGPHLIEMVL